MNAQPQKSPTQAPSPSEMWARIERALERIERELAARAKSAT